MKRRAAIASKTTPMQYIPKFQPGQRVRVSAEGVQWRIAPAGTMGTVEWCGLVVRVLIDGADRSQNYATDYWIAE